MSGPILTDEQRAEWALRAAQAEAVDLRMSLAALLVACRDIGWSTATSLKLGTWPYGVVSNAERALSTTPLAAATARVVEAVIREHRGVQAWQQALLGRDYKLVNKLSEEKPGLTSERIAAVDALLAAQGKGSDG